MFLKAKLSNTKIQQKSPSSTPTDTTSFTYQSQIAGSETLWTPSQLRSPEILKICSLLGDNLFPLMFHHGEGNGNPLLVLLPGESHGGRRSLVGCSPWGLKESDMTERLHFHFSLSRTGEGNGNPLQYACLENPRDGGAWWAAVYGVTQSQTQLMRLSSSSSSMFHHIHCLNDMTVPPYTRLGIDVLVSIPTRPAPAPSGTGGCYKLTLQQCPPPAWSPSPSPAPGSWKKKNKKIIQRCFEPSCTLWWSKNLRKTQLASEICHLIGEPKGSYKSIWSQGTF